MMVALVLLLALAACGNSGDSGSTPSANEPTPTRPAAAYLRPTPEIQPVQFPQDEAPHDMLTEWWYYTGHLFTPDGTRYGFEYVIFQAERGQYPPVYVGHFAVTDSTSGAFVYDQKIGPAAAIPAAEGFSFNLGGWTMSGALGHDHLAASMDRYAIDLDVAATKPPALHDGGGYVSFGSSGGSYYYSRTRMQATGTLTIDGSPRDVTGEVWMDHQWGNFISVGAGGWDWFSAQLDDGNDLTISLVHDESGGISGAYGTIVDPQGRATTLAADDLVVGVLDHWTSPTSGATYPSQWRITLPGHEWSLTVTPTLNDQELNTVATTGVIYWEGEVTVAGTVGGNAVTGLGYVELTGYAKPQ
jgi:predicted secreted hydrolase